MAPVTIEVPGELSDMVAQVSERLPELLARILKEPTSPTHVYRYILNFLTTRPTPEQVADFGPRPRWLADCKRSLNGNRKVRQHRWRRLSLTSTRGWNI